MMNPEKMQHQLRQLFLASPKTFMTVALGGSALCGWFCFTIMDRDQQLKEANLALQQHRGQEESSSNRRRVMSQEEARVRAMIEHAKESDWKENLDNAVQAQEHFMLPGRSGGGQPKFADKIDDRSQEMIREDRKQQRLQEQKATTRYWS
jgi:hypothetical protein